MDDDTGLPEPVDGTGAQLAPDLPLGARGTAAVQDDAVVTPGGVLRVHGDAVLTAELDGSPLGVLHGGPLAPDGSAALHLQDEPATLSWEPSRVGAWARPPRLAVRWRRHRWTLLAHSTQRELHGPGRADGPPRVRLVLEAAGAQLSWSAQATPRELALLVLLVRAAGPEAFRADVVRG